MSPAAVNAAATASQIAAIVSGELEGPGGLEITGVAALEEAGPGDLTFVRSDKYASRWAESRAAVALAPTGLAIPGHDPENPGADRAIVRVADPDAALIALLAELKRRSPDPLPAEGVSPLASVDPGARLAGGVVVGPFAVIGPGVTVGAGSVIHARVTLYAGVTIGSGVTIHAGAVIGADGFGYHPDPATGLPVKIPHLASVAVADCAEIGANTCIDRGKLADTVIGPHAKIDNLCQIGHSCRIGAGVVICGCCAIGGSTRIGDGAILGGACCVPDNITIAPGAVLGGGANVVGDVRAGEPWLGTPARPASTTTKSAAAVLQLPKLRERFKELAARVAALETRAAGTGREL